MGTYPGVIEASTEIQIPRVQVSTSCLPNLGLIDEVLPCVDVLQGHQVIDILNCVLERAGGELSVGSHTVQRRTHCISPQSVPTIKSKDGIELGGLQSRCDRLETEVVGWGMNAVSRTERTIAMSPMAEHDLFVSWRVVLTEFVGAASTVSMYGSTARMR